MRCSASLLGSALAMIVHVYGGAAQAQMPTYRLGRTPTAEEIRAWDIAIGPEGKELPPGSGTAKEGAAVFAQRCAKCHGPEGTGRAPLPTMPTPQGLTGPLVGGKGTLNTPRPSRTVGSSWPFATTIWDYVNRAMPQMETGTLSADEVYAVTAYLLYRNGIIEENTVMDAKSLPKVQMPNRNGFFPPVEELRRWQTIHESHRP